MGEQNDQGSIEETQWWIEAQLQQGDSAPNNA